MNLLPEGKHEYEYQKLMYILQIEKTKGSETPTLGSSPINSRRVPNHWSASSFADSPHAGATGPEILPSNLEMRG